MRHRRRVLAVTLLLTLACLPFAYQAVRHLDANLFNQVSGSLQRFRVLRELSEEFGGDLLAGVASIPENPTPAQVEELKRFGDLLAAELEKAGLAPSDTENLSDELKKRLPEGKPWLVQVECRTGKGMEAERPGA
ncbi:MAG: hypothetical protein HY291_05485 [Planctomycetes bacterium]|nr:hypothetical protein [Planctomycetota bacterium]